MSSDEEDHYSRKTDDDRTLYLRRTGFGHAGRSILASEAPPKAKPISPLGSKMLAPRFGAHGDPLRGSRDYSDDEENDYNMDEMDELNMSSEFEASPPRETKVSSSPNNRDERNGRQETSSQDNNRPLVRSEGKTQEKAKPKILPPPKMPPPKGARNASAARLQFQKAPPKGGKPSGARSAAAQYRAQLLKKKSERDMEGKTNASSEPARNRVMTPTFSSKTQEPNEIKTLRSSNEGSIQNDLRRVVRTSDETPPTKRKNRTKAKAHVFGVASSEDEEEVGRDWTNENAREKAVMSVFSHDWEMQSPEAKQQQEQQQRNHKVHRPSGSGRFSSALAAQAKWEVEGDLINTRDDASRDDGGPTISVMEDEEVDVGDEGDEGDEGEDYEERRSGDYEDYDARRDRDRIAQRDRRDNRRRVDDDDEYEIATDSEEEEPHLLKQETLRQTPKKMRRGEGKSSAEDENREEARKMQDEIDVDPRGNETKTDTGDTTVVESKTFSETKADQTENRSPSPNMSDLVPGEITVYDASAIPYERNQLREWLVNPPVGGEEQMVRCFIERDKRGFNRFYPLFRFYVEVEGSQPRLLMYARKLKGKMSGNYLVSLDEKDMGKARHKRGDGYIGKLQSSGSGEYTMYDDGVNPNVDTSIGSSKNVDIRRELCVIAYASKNGSHRPTQDRRMEVAIPAIIARPDGQEHSVTWRPRTKEDGMRTWFRRIRLKGSQNVISRERMLCLHNRMWSHGRTCQLEEFMQRAQETSSKNFQLVVSPPEDPFLRNKYDASPLGTINTDDVANVLVQMGRCSDRFNVDFQYPVSAFAAFGICLTRFSGSAGVKT